MNIKEQFIFRNINKEEGEEAVLIESICFPPNEACSRKHMLDRVENIGELFLVAYCKENNKIAGFLNGLATDEEKFDDKFFTDVKNHNTDGKNIMLLGLDVRPEYRRRGLARAIVEEYVKRERKNNRNKLILTCVDDKVSMYEKMGFELIGESASVWGGERWNEMVYYLNK